MFTLNQMKYFMALSETGHFGKAAAKVFVTQPAMSVQIAEMESKVGETLFERARGRVLLTDKGKKIFPLIKKILSETKELEYIIQNDSGVNQINLGIIPTVAPYILPQIFLTIKEKRPGLSLRIRETLTENLVNELAKGDLDVFIAANPINDRFFASKVLFNDSFFFATTKDLASPLNQSDIPLDDILLLEEGHCMRTQALDICDKANYKVSRNYGVSSLSTLVNMVGNGLGDTLLPQISLKTEAENKKLKLIPFSTPYPSRTISLFYRKETSHLSEIDILVDVIKDAHKQVIT